MKTLILAILLQAVYYITICNTDTGRAINEKHARPALYDFVSSHSVVITGPSDTLSILLPKDLFEKYLNNEFQFIAE